MIGFPGSAELSLLALQLLGQAGQEAPPAPAAPPEGPQEPGGLLGPFGGGMNSFWLMIALIFLVMYFLVIRPESRRQRTREAMLKAVKKGDTVITAGGLIGRVQRVDEKEVVLQIDKDSSFKARCLKSAITEVLPEGKSPEKGPGSEAVKESSASNS